LVTSQRRVDVLLLSPRLIDLRKLAAIDIFFLGSKLILGEFAAGVLLSTALGIFVLLRGHTFWQVVLGAYLICLGINYVPMFFYAVAITRQQSARGELAGELADKRKAMSKYRHQSLVLLIPLAAPILVATRPRSTPERRSERAG
jgi:hypothetical protein